MKILITGIGNVGKSTWRRQLLKELRLTHNQVEHFDADCFKKLRHQADADCLKELPQNFSPDAIYVIEDIHATLPQAVLPLSEYDSTTYIIVGPISQILFWLPRAWRWFAAGRYSWEAKSGWQGNRKPYSLRNLPGIIKVIGRDIGHRKRWIKEDWEKIKHCSNLQIVRASWSIKGPKFSH
jgi:GTPase SAR1 family protein